MKLLGFEVCMSGSQLRNKFCRSAVVGDIDRLKDVEELKIPVRGVRNLEEWLVEVKRWFA